MPATPFDPREGTSAVEPTVEGAAALDDYLAGFAADATSGADLPPVESGLLDTILLLRQAAAADGTAPTPAAPAVPRSIGRHAIVRLAGEGGFATVWEGFDTLLRRPVAVKVRRPEMLLSESARRRFAREAEIAARLVHPHIVTIFEVGEEQGREFIAAEFCSGGSLAGWLERHPGPLPAQDSARLVRALAGAVAHAHAAGVVHRDIKPANVLLVPAPPGTEPILRPAVPAAAAGPGLTVKLADFGLGKRQDDDASDPLTQLTRTGATIGTPAWMAPEQVDRTLGEIGPATDVHALGLLLDRLLTGRALRGGRTDAETYRQVLLDEPLPADTVVRSVPRDLAAVALKCLAKQPRDRYASACDLADDLGRWLDGRPTHARPLSVAGRALRSIRRRPGIAGLAAAVVAATLVAGWAGVQRLREARVAAGHAEEIRGQQAVAALRRGFEALRAGNVAGGLAQLDATRSLDPGLADSLAGRWLVRRMHGEQAILLGPPGSGAGTAARPRDLYAITVSPDGRMAAVAGADGGVRLLRGLDGSPTVATVAAHDEVNDVNFSADGRRLTTVGQDGRLRWWAITDRGLDLQGEAAPGAGPLYAAAFTPDGTAIAFGGEDRVVRMMSLAAPAQAAPLFEFESPPGKSPEVESIVFIDDATLAASCGDLTILLDAATGRVVRELHRPQATTRNAVLGSLAVSADGRRLMGCGTDNQAHIWELATGKALLSLPVHPAWVQGCCFLAGGDRVATACRDGSIRVFDVETGRLAARLVGHVGRVWSIAAEPSGTLLSCGADGTVRRWSPEADLEIATLRKIDVDGEDLFRIAEGPRPDAGRGGHTLFVIDARAGLQRIDVERGSSRHLLPPGAPRAVELAGDGSGRRLALSWADAPQMSLFDLDSPAFAAGAGDRPAAAVGTPVAGLPVSIDQREAIPCWTSRGELVVCSRRGVVCLLPPEGAAISLDSPLEDPVHALVEAPAGPPRVAAAGRRSAILRLPTAGQKATPPVEVSIGEESSAVAWSPDATLLACGTRTGRVLFCDGTSGAVRGELVPHQRRINHVVFSRDGRCLVTVDDECVRISDASTRTTLDEIRPGWQIQVARLTADEACLVLGGRPAAESRPGSGPLAVMEFTSP